MTIKDLQLRLQRLRESGIPEDTHVVIGRQTVGLTITEIGVITVVRDHSWDDLIVIEEKRC